MNPTLSTKAAKRSPFKRYRFSSQIRTEIQKLNRVDNWHGPLQVAMDWLWIVTAVAVSLYCWQAVPTPIALMVYFGAVAVIGARQRGLRVNNHQATHHALAHNPWLNYLLGTVFSGWPVLESYSGYDDTHNSLERGHHPNLGTEQDVDHMAVVRQGLYGEGRTPANARRYLLSIPLKTPGYLQFLLQNRIWNPEESLGERWARFLYLGCIISVLFATGQTNVLLLYWIVPLVTTANWVGAVIQLAEHYPLMEQGHTLELYVSRNRILDPISGFFFSAHDEGYHLIHHLYPKMPFWNFRIAHDLLLSDPTYASLHPEDGLESLFSQIVG